MASIAFLDDSFPFTGESLRTAPLGGIQTAVVCLAEALAARGHTVSVFGKVERASRYADVDYRPLPEAGAERFDLVISCAVAKLYRPGMGGRRVLWLHNPANYFRKPRHFLPYLRWRPSVVFLGSYHRGTWPAWLPVFGGDVIAHGVAPVFLETPPADEPPPPDAVFTSNPRRGLDWLLDIWAGRIHPAAPDARLYIYGGGAAYGGGDTRIEAALERARAMTADGVRVHGALAKPELAEALAASRVMLYRGDLGETYCLAAAEAGAVGVPLVTQGVGALVERTGAGGLLARTNEAFAEAAVRVLTDDAAWRELHDGALAGRASSGWDAVAEVWERRFLVG